MSLPVLLHSGMQGAPQIKGVNGLVNAMLYACLCNGFNTQSVSSATASGGVATFNFATAPGFNGKDTVFIEGASNAAVNGKWRVLSAASNQVLVSIPGLADGALGGTILMKFAPLGWTRAFSGTNLGAYKMGGTATHKRFIRISDGSLTSSYLYWRGYENMTAISTGTNPFPTTSEVSGNGVGGYLANDATANAPWIIVGTPRAFYLCIEAYWYNYTDVPPVWKAGIVGNPMSLAFGEMADIQKVGDTYATYISQNDSSAQVWLGRAATGANNSRPTADITGAGAANTFSALNTFPDPVSGNIVLEGPARIDEVFASQKGVRGYFPGMLTNTGYMVRASSYANYTGQMFTGFPGVTGRLVAMGWGRTADEFMLRMDEDWGDE